jgi:aldehyde dehydrogenase (NAD+)
MAVKVEVQSFPLFINGKWEPASNQETFDVFNPATGELVAKVSKGTVADVDTAVMAAREAFDNTEWKNMNPKDRAKVLYAISYQIAEHAEELAYLEAISSGGTVRRIGNSDILQMVDLFQTLANFTLEYPFSETLPVPPFPGPAHNFIWREPIGVCAAITPWNLPMVIATWKIAPALAMGKYSGH